jgi:hypothetical protein
MSSPTTDRARCARRAVRQQPDAGSGLQAGECPAGSGANTVVLPAATHLLEKSPGGGELTILADFTISGAKPSSRGFCQPVSSD